MTQLAVTTETDFGVDTPVTVGFEPEPPVLLPEEPVELLLPEPPTPAVEELPPQPTSRMTSAPMHAWRDHILNDIQHSSLVGDAAQQEIPAQLAHQHGVGVVYEKADLAGIKNPSQDRSAKCEGRQLRIERARITSDSWRCYVISESQQCHAIRARRAAVGSSRESA